TTRKIAKSQIRRDDRGRIEVVKNDAFDSPERKLGVRSRTCPSTTSPSMHIGAGEQTTNAGSSKERKSRNPTRISRRSGTSARSFHRLSLTRECKRCFSSVHRTFVLVENGRCMVARLIQPTNTSWLAGGNSHPQQRSNEFSRTS